MIPSISGHAAVAEPPSSPLANFAGVSRSTTITAWIAAHGLRLLRSPTRVVVGGGLASAAVRYDRYLRCVWPRLLATFVVSTTIIAAAAALAGDGPD